MKIICNTPGKGRLQNPNPLKGNQYGAEITDEWEAFENTVQTFDAFHSDHTTPLPVGYIGEAELVWQYRCDDECEFEWDGCLNNDPLHYRPLADVRCIYIASIPAPNSVSEETQPLTDSEYLNLYGAPDGTYPKPVTKEGKGVTGKKHNPQHFKGIHDLNTLLDYAGKYQISIQFWGEGCTNVFIEKDGIDLTDFGGLNPEEAIRKTVEYLDRINRKSHE